MAGLASVTAVLALAGPKPAARPALFLTLHNSYDSGPVTPEDLQGVGIHPGRRAGIADPVHGAGPRPFPAGQTLFTVSEQFARDFTEDIFQARVMADTWQDELRPPHVIVSTTALHVPGRPGKPGLRTPRRATTYRWREWKIPAESSLCRGSERFVPDEQTRPVWAAWPASRRWRARWPTCPGSSLAGRDDTAAEGIRRCGLRRFARSWQKPGNDAKRSSSSSDSPGDEGRRGCSSCRGLAQAFPANILVLPFILPGKDTLPPSRGPRFGVMPSFYETVRHMANEFYLNGAVGHRPPERAACSTDRAAALPCRRSRRGVDRRSKRLAPGCRRAAATGLPGIASGGQTTRDRRDWKAFQ